ncbi:MAG: hypothetical protein Tsb0013_17270 [Phycisphaerales bacterium]
MLRTIRHTFLAGVAIALVAFIASACVGLMNRAPATATAAGAPPESPQPLSDLYKPRPLEGEPIIRVRIAQDTRTATIAGAQRVTVTPPGIDPELLILRTPVVVRRSALGWSVTSEGDTRKIEDAPRATESLATALVIKPLADELITLDGTALPGWLALHAPDRRAEFDVVEHVNIEAYLPGVVTKELYSTWRPETFQAQAIAARSYALHERARRRSLGSYYDVVSTTQDQAYGGATQHTVAHQAVRDTAGLVLTWDGSILRTYYSSTVGGRAASAADTWPIEPGFEFNLAEPIQASPRGDEDRISPRFRWEATRTTREIGARLRAYADGRTATLKGIGTVRSIEVIERNDFDRPVRYRVTDTKGDRYEMRAEALRMALNHPAAGYKDIDRDTRVYSSDMDIAFRGDTATIRGRGFGHGVGMSQFGAEALARDGWDPERILLYYYPGARIERAY